MFGRANNSVSIVMRTRDRGLYLPRALESVLGQSHSNWQLLIVNDGGDFAALRDILVPYQTRAENRIHLLNHVKVDDTNIAGPLNLAFRSSKSDFLAVHDDDDSWHPDFLRKSLECLTDKSYAGSVAKTELVWEKIENGELKELRREIYNAWQGNAISLFRLGESNTFAPIALVFRRSVLAEIGYRREDLGPLEDWEFNLRLCAAHPVAFLTEPLARYHQRISESASGRNANFFHSHANLYGYLDTKIRNELLRKDLAEGRFGLGFLTNLSASHGSLFQKIQSLGAEIDLHLGQRP